MLQWSTLQPYNSVHVLRFDRPLEFDKLKGAIDETLETNGLASVSLDSGRGTYLFHAGPADCEIKPTGGENPRIALVSEIEQQLNSPFPEQNPFLPFRFFAAPQEDCFYLGMAYFHAIADGESIIYLMKEISERYCGGRPENGPQSLDLYPAPYLSLFRRAALLARKLMSLPSGIRKIAISCRAAYAPRASLNRVDFLSLKPDELELLLKKSRSLQATVNDLLMALLMKCLVPRSKTWTRPGRRNISIGGVVNTRKDLGLAGQRKFGLFLGSFFVTHPLPTDFDLVDLAKNIRRQTLAIKKAQLYLVPLEMTAGRFFFHLFPANIKEKFYRKYHPLWGGVTNMNLNALWPQESSDRTFDYFRAVSTDPATPLVLSATTVADVMNIVLTYRSTAFRPPHIEEFKACFYELLKQLA